MASVFIKFQGMNFGNLECVCTVAGLVMGLYIYVCVCVCVCVCVYIYTHSKWTSKMISSSPFLPINAYNIMHLCFAYVTFVISYAEYVSHLNENSEYYSYRSANNNNNILLLLFAERSVMLVYSRSDVTQSHIQLTSYNNV